MASNEWILGHTWLDLYGEQLTVSQLISIIEKNDPHELLRVFAIVGMKLAESYGSDLEEHWRLAEEFFPAEILTDMNAKNPDHLGFWDNYGLTVLAQMTIRYGKFSENKNKPVRRLDLAVLVLSVNNVMMPTALKYENTFKSVARHK